MIYEDVALIIKRDVGNGITERLWIVKALNGDYFTKLEYYREGNKSIQKISENEIEYFKFIQECLKLFRNYKIEEGEIIIYGITFKPFERTISFNDGSEINIGELTLNELKLLNALIKLRLLGVIDKLNAEIFRKQIKIIKSIEEVI